MSTEQGSGWGQQGHQGSLTLTLTPEAAGRQALRCQAGERQRLHEPKAFLPLNTDPLTRCNPPTQVNSALKGFGEDY